MHSVHLEPQPIRQALFLSRWQHHTLTITNVKCQDTSANSNRPHIFALLNLIIAVIVVAPTGGKNVIIAVIVVVTR
jgi:hypothetical protein